MTKITLGGYLINTIGSLPKIDTLAPDFNLIKKDLTKSSLSDYKGFKVILNIFPSIDTRTCAASVRQFNQEASNLEKTKVLCISRDLPFAQSRFCGAEGIENVICLSDFATGDFGKEYGVEIVDGPFAYLHARAVIILDKKSKVIYTEMVAEIDNEPNYKKALKAVSKA